MASEWRQDETAVQKKKKENIKTSGKTQALSQNNEQIFSDTGKNNSYIWKKGQN